MPFLAGIDEAGYSPTLGPLVVSCLAVRVDDSGAALDGSDLWERLAPGGPGANSATPGFGIGSFERGESSDKLPAVATPPRVARPGRGKPPAGTILVGDSKQVYTPAKGIGELERAVLSIVGWTCGRAIADGADLIDAVSALPDELPPAWERPEYGGFPLDDQTVLPCESLGAHGSGVEPVLLMSRVVSPAEFNRGIERTDNKATFLWEIVASHLRRAWDAAGDEPCHVTVDRLGGRARYAGPLGDALGGWVWTLNESRGVSAYRVEKDGRTIEVTFREKADDASLPVAVASMTSKYLRELMMERLNGYFRKHAPDLKPTAGYPKDAKRFLEQTAALRRKLGVDDARFIRSR